MCLIGGWCLVLHDQQHEQRSLFHNSFQIKTVVRCCCKSPSPNVNEFDHLFHGNRRVLGFVSCQQARAIRPPRTTSSAFAHRGDDLLADRHPINGSAEERKSQSHKSPITIESNRIVFAFAVVVTSACERVTSKRLQGYTL